MHNLADAAGDENDGSEDHEGEEGGVVKHAVVGACFFAVGLGVVD